MASKSKVGCSYLGEWLSIVKFINRLSQHFSDVSVYWIPFLFLYEITFLLFPKIEEKSHCFQPNWVKYVTEIMLSVMASKPDNGQYKYNYVISMVSIPESWETYDSCWISIIKSKIDGNDLSKYFRLLIMKTHVCFLLLYVPSQQQWSWRDGQFT